MTSNKPSQVTLWEIQKKVQIIGLLRHAYTTYMCSDNEHINEAFNSLKIGYACPCLGAFSLEQHNPNYIRFLTKADGIKLVELLDEMIPYWILMSKNTYDLSTLRNNIQGWNSAQQASL